MPAHETPPGARVAPVWVRRPGGAERDERKVATEAPVSLEFNGLAYAVMMATPTDLEDFALGFSLSEQVVAVPGEVRGIDVTEAELGWIVRIEIDPARIGPIHARIRQRVSDGGCGLCGIENLEQAMRLPPPVRRGAPSMTPDAIFRALEALRTHQPLNAATGAVHAAAMCGADGAILAVREDVGRHNAFDKLIGALARNGTDPGDGFALLSSRCSYELVDKALTAGFTALATISAATSLAATRATEQGLTLVALARPDAFLVMNDPFGRMI
jgi:FdhD protein